nr:unnamed protein product [Naegleria fowleri]
MCYEFMKYLTPKDLFSLMQSCRTFYEIIHQLKLLRPDAYNGLCICEERFEYYKISYLNLLYNYGQHLSHSELLFLSDSSLQHSCSQAMDLILGWLDISSPDICHILIKYDNRMSSGDVNQAMETFMRHPKIQELTSEVVEYLVSEQRFSLLENLPSVDFASFFQEILEVQPSFFATHPSILFQRWKQRKDRDLIVKHFTSIFRRMEENQELDELVLDFLEMMNKKERQVQRKWVVESLSQEFQKSLLKRRSLVLEYGVDIMMFSLNISRHHMVICCLKVDPDLFSKELDLPRLSMELIDRCRYYLLAELVKLLKMKAISAVASSPRNYLRFILQQAHPLGKRDNYIGRRDIEMWSRREHQQKSLNYLIETIGKLFPNINYLKNQNEIRKKAAALGSSEISQTITRLERSFIEYVKHNGTEVESEDDSFDEQTILLLRFRCERLHMLRE